MLSTENPPPDLYEISQLKSGDGGSDDRASDNNKQQLEVDLLKSGLDYNPLPKFSIRDYVFKTRGKNIKNNWPFSQKNLQVCLKHGVQDVLPPFQSLDSLKNPSIEEGVVDSLRYSDHVKYPDLSNGSVCERPAVNIENLNSSECDEDKELPSTTTRQSCSAMNSVPPVRNSCSEREAQYLLRERPEFAVRECKKAESSTRSLAKKGRLILKLNNIAEPKSAEDSAACTPVVSEAMSSKVCPVCKTFSSSSNTTLNAHIDQCLSGESIKLTANLIKHRIKPRKTRLMVDIYETALPSTLEDLDKRNGTNWATNMGLHSQDLSACSKEGAVYIDSSGTKLRILSKLGHLPSKSNINDAGPPKFVKRDTFIKLLSSKKKKKKHTVQKLELQKSSLDGQGSCSPIPDLLPDCPPDGPRSCNPRVEVDDVRQKIYPPEGDKEDNPTKSPTPSDHMKSDDLGMIKQWVGSKRSDLKKINLEVENHLLDKSLKNLRTKSASSLVDRANSSSMSPTSSDDNPVLPAEGLIRKENLSRSHDGRTQLLSQRKELGFPLLRSDHLTDKKGHVVPSKFNVQWSRKDTTSFHKRLMDPPNSAENRASSCSNKKMGISSGPAATNSSGGRKFSSLRSKLLSVRHASGAQLKKNSERELLNSKNPRLRYALLSDEEAVVSQSPLHAEDNLSKALGGNATLMEKGSGELLTNRSRVLRIHKKIGRREMTSKGSETSTESDTLNAENEIDSFTSGSVPVDTSVSEEEAEMLDAFVREPTSTDGEGFVSFSKSLDSTFPGLTGSNVECGSQYYSKAYDIHCPAELVFHADQEMFCADNVGNELLTRDGHEMAVMDGDERQGNYFVDVEPIPIPGPPGSFLPSPGRMGSEELLGYSSLTTCRIQSSDDGHGVVDMDSSDSPVSAMSTVSNSVAGRSSSISTANLSAQSHFRHESQLDTMKERISPVVEGSHFRELNLLKLKANSMLPEVTREVQDIQPCCCSRKDVSLQGGPSNYQELQILRRRTRTSPSVLALEKQLTDDADNGVRCYDLGAAQKEPTPVTRNGYTHVPVPHSSEAIFRACGDCDFPSPSTSNSVLRLMGKNLMVVKKDDHLSPATRPTHSSMMIEHPSVRLCVENGLSTRNNPNQPNSFHHMLSQVPSMSDNMQPRTPAQQFDFNSSDAFKNPTNHWPSSKLPSHPSPAMFPVHHHLKTLDSSADKHKEIIIIDDTPEIEAGSAVKATHCPTNMKPRESIPSMLLLPPDARHVNPFYSYHQTRVDPRFTPSPMVVAKGMTANLGKWNCIPEGSAALHSSPSSASLPSSAHHRSMHFSP